MAAFAAMTVAGLSCKEVPNAVLKLLFTEYTAACGTESKFLKKCFEEQVKTRVLRIVTTAPAAAEAALQGEDIDISPGDPAAWATARDLHKTWTAAAGNILTCAMLTALSNKDLLP